MPPTGISINCRVIPASVKIRIDETGISGANVLRAPYYIASGRNEAKIMYPPFVSGNFFPHAKRDLTLCSFTARFEQNMANVPYVPDRAKSIATRAATIVGILAREKS